MVGDRIIGGLDVDTYTSAPLQVCRSVFLDAPPRSVFALVSDHANLDWWLPRVHQVHVNRGHAAVRDGVGTIRYVHYELLLTYTVREYIIAHHPPSLIAYSIERNNLITDHVAVISIDPERYGGTQLIWRHYFRAESMPFLIEPLCSILLHLMCGAALRNLIRYYGGRLS